MINLALIVITAAVAVLLLLLKTNAGMVFLSLCAGNVLVQFANKNMAYINGHLNSHLVPHYFLVSKPILLVIILLLPPVLTAVLSKRDQGITKWAMQIFPAVATGLVGSLLVVPLLSASTQTHITQNKFWNLLEQYQVIIVALGVVVSVVVVVLNSYSHGSRHHAKS